MRKTAFVFIAVTGGLYAQASPPAIAVPVPQLATFGMIGLAAGQTARVNALGFPMGGPIINGSACTVTLTFLDDAGKSLGTSTQPVVGGAAVHFDLKRTDIDAATDRRQIRATVRANFALPPGIESPVAFGFCSVKPTLEIFDNENGRTMAVLADTTSLPLILPLATGN
jgi:hypothetical protein